MTQVAKPGNADAAKRADADIFKKYPDRKSKPLTMSPADAALRAEWLVLYERYGGQVVHRNGPKAPISKQRKRVEVQTAPLGVYVYIVKMAGDDPWGHVGLILQQPDRSYIRYSQAADNPNLQGTDRWEYCTWQQDVRVRQVKFARGTDVKTIIKGASIIADSDQACRQGAEGCRRLHRGEVLLPCDHEQLRRFRQRRAERG
jgi:hypothetical protein